MQLFPQKISALKKNSCDMHVVCNANKCNKTKNLSKKRNFSLIHGPKTIHGQPYWAAVSAMAASQPWNCKGCIFIASKLLGQLQRAWNNTNTPCQILAATRLSCTSAQETEGVQSPKLKLGAFNLVKPLIGSLNLWNWNIAFVWCRQSIIIATRCSCVPPIKDDSKLRASRSKDFMPTS